ncbi:hypothetical protein [Leptospira licerasiae]|uniref:hypothetical protein n=1 Tax=Leptospira licerasiae TaxID=447106 RepID=UPI001AF026A3|nr:hypothetical protein [Leptospira licerasiae]
MMNLLKLPIANCNINCPFCNLPGIEIKIFESGMGGDFQTLYGKSTGTYYRIDLTQIGYLNLSLQSCLDEVYSREKGEVNVEEIPRKLHCKICKKNSIFTTEMSISFNNDEFINTMVLP